MAAKKLPKPTMLEFRFSSVTVIELVPEGIAKVIYGFPERVCSHNAALGNITANDAYSVAELTAIGKMFIASARRLNRAA